MKQLNIMLLLAIMSWQSWGQQDPQYTQYMYNMNVVNPAYAGSTEGNLSIGALYRSQWVGLDGAPSTGTFAIHAPSGKNVGLGFSLISDEVGPVSETNAYADFSYTLDLANANKLAFGVKAGATFHDIGVGEDQVEWQDPGDPFAQNINEVTPNVGAGAYFYKPNRYYASLSMPNILNAVHLDANGTKIGSETQHLFAAAGYVFDLSEDFKLKPHGLLKTAFSAPVSFDLNANLFMYDIVEVGLGYRLEDSFSGMINFLISPQLRIGYSYDSVQSDLDVVTSASHEIFVNFDINFTKKVSRSPRYF